MRGLTEEAAFLKTAKIILETALFQRNTDY